MNLKIQLYKDDNLVLENKNIAYEKDENLIYFELENMFHQIDTERKILERYNDEFHFYLNFEEEKCTYELKSHNAIFDITVDQSFFEITDHQIEMSYAIETDDSKTKILIEFL